MHPHKKSVTNLALYGCFLLLAIWIYIETADFPKPLLPGYPGSAMFPRFTLVLMGLLSIAGIASELLRLRSRPPSPSPARAPVPLEGDAGDDAPVTPGDFIIVLATLAVFVAVTQVAGMEVGVFVFSAAMVWFVTRRLVSAILAGVGAVAVVYVVFVQGLSVFMPLTFLPRYLTW